MIIESSPKKKEISLPKQILPKEFKEELIESPPKLKVMRNFSLQTNTSSTILQNETDPMIQEIENNLLDLC